MEKNKIVKMYKEKESQLIGINFKMALFIRNLVYIKKSGRSQLLVLTRKVVYVKELKAMHWITWSLGACSDHRSCICHKTHDHEYMSGL